MFAKDPEVMDKAKELIEKEAKLKQIDIMEGKGPAFDSNINEDEKWYISK